MLSSRLATGLKEVPKVLKRNIGILAPALQKASDPIQQLFVDKIREYKSKNTGSKTLVDASPETIKELQSELEKAAKHAGGGGGVDLTQFPQFKFDEPKVDPINMQTQ
ncbi:ATP synthase-coupling factor 6, mitochondrial [Neodiprion pinetum]|uniref:ATP synthase-coupling factor 6, mitochondrial n=1 Tax=Neodiprion lecontei TaxID=441921 RepID=A0A6J0C0A4_NEOLC|nr:ATP synthase-coupling factor 6, mitochondrial [Neodiprion lecontei]XP_046423759.1 ATP synthase-coupling factor 6, mitochondrial [Neodiprion fabricii]XP_046479200.1 ATP synthase-coupling factor 6, mitochondrial [Neodiprion pinetum]XP_046617427.1 ATP synthase-coupling factor 6, mitochondrial [Neodiprion virginianus]